MEAHRSSAVHPSKKNAGIKEGDAVCYSFVAIILIDRQAFIKFLCYV